MNAREIVSNRRVPSGTAAYRRRLPVDFADDSGTHQIPGKIFHSLMPRSLLFWSTRCKLSLPALFTLCVLRFLSHRFLVCVVDFVSFGCSFGHHDN
jgi:hypothetical protein